MLPTIFKIFKIFKNWLALKLASSHLASCQPASHSVESQPIFKYFKYFRYFRYFGKHLLNEMLISLSKSYQIGVLGAPQAFKMYRFAKGIRRFSCFHGCLNSRKSVNALSKSIDFEGLGSFQNSYLGGFT